MKTYTTTEAAQMAGISRQTLYQWLRQRRVRPPQQIRLGLTTHYLWTQADIDAAHASALGTTVALFLQWKQARGQ